MRYICFRLTLFGLLPVLFFAQVPDTMWTRTYGNDSTDIGVCVQQTSDDGFIIAGYKYQSGQYDLYLIKTDENGDTLWTKVYDITSEQAVSVQQTTDHGYILTGFGDISNMQVFAMKTDSLGDSIWTGYYGSGGISHRGYAVEQTSDGNYILTGYTDNVITRFDLFLVKIDSLGDTLWTRCYGGLGYDEGRSIHRTTDGGYIVSGRKDSDTIPTDFDIYLVKTDSLGDTLWTREYGGPGSENGYSVRQTFDGGYIVAGYTDSYGPSQANIYLLKTDGIGDTLWTKVYGYSGSDYARSVRQTADSGYIIVGYTDYPSGYEDIWLLRTDTNGDTLWTQRYGGSDDDRAYCVDLTSDHGYIIVGRTYSFGAGERDVYLIKIAPDTFNIEENQIMSPEISSLDIFPNPFRDRTDIRWQMTDDRKVDLEIYNVSGRLVRQWDDRTIRPSNRVTWNGTDDYDKKLPNGIYFVQLKGKDFTSTKKILLLE